MVRYSEMARPAVRVLNRGGRPTRGEAERRQEHLIETAGAMFMKFGFDGTSIDAVAEAACMSKRTVYARYRDKNELFSAVLRNLIDRWLVPINQFQLGTRELSSWVNRSAGPSSGYLPMPKGASQQFEP